MTGTKQKRKKQKRTRTYLCVCDKEMVTCLNAVRKRKTTGAADRRTKERKKKKANLKLECGTAFGASQRARSVCHHLRCLQNKFVPRHAVPDCGLSDIRMFVKKVM